MNQWWRLGGACGLAFIVIFIIAGFVLQADGPSITDDADEIRAYWADDGDAYILSDWVIGLAVFLLFLPFLSALRSLLGLYEGGSQMWSRLVFTGGVLFVALAGAAAASWLALAYAAPELEDESLRLLMYLDLGAWNGTSFPIGLMLLASSIVIWQTGVLWKWLAIIGVIAGICALIGPLALLDEDVEEGTFGLFGFAAFIGLAIWMLLTSIGMLMKREVVAMGPTDGGAAAREVSGV
jgi:hypothetical protein